MYDLLTINEYTDVLVACFVVLLIACLFHFIIIEFIEWLASWVTRVKQQKAIDSYSALSDPTLDKSFKGQDADLAVRFFNKVKRNIVR